MITLALSLVLALGPSAAPTHQVEVRQRPSLADPQTVGGPPPPDAFDRAVAAMVAWHDDPVLYVRQVFGAEPDDWQADTLRAVARDPRVGMSACKGPGKTTVLAWIGWWFVDTRPHGQVICTSITADNLRDNLWKEFSVWYAKAPHLQRAFEIKGERIIHREHPKTWWISARSWAQGADPSQQANSLAGFHGKHVLNLLDEMGDYPDGVEIAAEGIFANSAIDEAKLVAAWNPTRTDGPAYRVCTRDRKRWTIIHITGDPDDPKRSPRISREWAQQMIDDWGRDNPWVMVNVLGLFPSQASDKLIGANDVQLAMERDVPAHSFRTDPRIWGLDPARYGDDEAALCRRQGIVCFRFITWRNLDGPQLADRVGGLLLEAEKTGELPDAIFVDVGGVGASAYDHLRLLGWGSLVHAVDFGGSPDDPRYADKRAEMWDGTARWIKKLKGCLPTDPELPGQLTAPSFKFRPRGKRTCFVLESKEDLRKRGVPSPDRADALALTFAGPVNPVGRKAREQNQRSTKSITEYDPYAS